MANSGTSAFQPDSDVHISYEDQQKINQFARHNAKLEDLKEELKLKQNEMKNLEEASDELELMDGTEKIPCFLGEMIIYQYQEDAQKTVSDIVKNVSSEIQNLESKCSEIRSVMSDLKTQLYAKFGNHINLEADDEE